MENRAVLGMYRDNLTGVQRLSGQTVRAYYGTVRAVAEWLETHHDVSLLEAERHHLRSWRGQLAGAVATVRAYTTHIRLFYRWACTEEITGADPTLGLPLPRLPRRLPRPIPEDAMEWAISTASPRVRPWLVLAGYAGLRACEIASMDRSLIYDTAPDPYLVVVGKGGQPRTVPISPYVWTAIRPGLPRRGWVYRRADGRPVTAEIVSRSSNRHLRSCGADATLHQLRHRFGTEVQRAFRDLRVTQELMGHASPATTAGYAMVAPPDAVAAVLAVQPAVYSSGSSGTSTR